MNTIKRPSRRLARWIDEFQAYNIDIRYRPGRDAILPDTLSRRPDFAEQIHAMVLSEDYIPHIEQYLNDGSLPQDSRLRSQVLDHASSFAISDERLHRRLPDGQLVPYIEPLFRADFIQRIHDQFGHLRSYGSIANAIESRAWWPGMQSTVVKFLSGCPKCQLIQRQRSGQERDIHSWLQIHSFNHFSDGVLI